METKGQKPPGQKLIKKMTLKTKWLLTSVAAYFLFGFGLCFFVIGLQKIHDGYDKATWIFISLLSLTIIFTGLAFFANGIIYQMEIKSRKIWKQKQKYNKKMRAETKSNSNTNIQKSPQK
ncbi:hypothetical protein EGI22_07315 [Lacihabitans sp. LS3-19]|uniref:hypothetical protein n=1 Tax=Lacihabitans sp. LS3-19 TaxID=2487335 RepID=UPI0020CBC76F|nr:hypothetical protein [Lacihabitans sp. LS3-19]MCP9767717.1 hypothetical protein [Lacihabitans sp. LS3-19]